MLEFIRENKKSLSFMFSSLWKHKRIFYIFLLWEWSAGIFLVIFPIIAKWETDQLVEKNTQIGNIFSGTFLEVFIFILLFTFVLKFFERFLESVLNIIKTRYTKLFEIDYENALFQRLSQVPLWTFLNSRNKRVISDSLFWGYDIWNFIRWVLGPIVRNTISVVGIIVVLSYYQFSLLIIIVVSSIGVYYFQKYKEIYNLKHELSQNYEYEYRLSRIKYEMWENTHQVTINGGSELMKKQFYDFWIYQLSLTQKLQKTETLFDMWWFVVQNIGSTITKWLVGYFVLQGTQSIWFMTMTLLYMTQFENIIQDFQNMNFQKNRFEDGVRKLTLFLWLTTSTQKEASPTSLVMGDISFTDVTFHYPNISHLELKYFDIIEKRIKKYGNKPSESQQDELHTIMEARKEAKITPPTILQDISCHFTRWNVYGIVWRNGAGKTTLTHLILWFFENYKWNISLGNLNYSQLDNQELYQSFSIVTQVPYILMDFSIRENLLLWVEKNYSDEELYSQLKRYRLDNKIKKLRLGLDTKIGYDSDFSGWEKQLLALVRTILQDRYLIIMDEGTNQLDAENEILVMEELLRNKKDKIIIFITHRMTTIRKADIIYCLDEWTISNRWTHKELLQGNNIYKNFWEKQVVL